jgi:hypothetical protein
LPGRRAGAALLLQLPHALAARHPSAVVMVALGLLLLTLAGAAVAAAAAAAPPSSQPPLVAVALATLDSDSNDSSDWNDADELHVFWGMAGDDDLTIPDNNCTFCFAAGNFIRSAPANVQVQPSMRDPHPSAGCPTCEPPIAKSPGWRDFTPGSKAMNRTVRGLRAAPINWRTLSFDGGAPCGNHHPADNLFAALGDKSVCRNAHGQLTNWSGLWWDHGIQHLTTDWAAYLRTLKAAGGSGTSSPSTRSATL